MEIQNKKYFTEKNAKLLFTILALVVLVLVIIIALPYINSIILAVIVAYIVQPIYKFLTKKLKTKKVSASLLSTALIVLFTLIIGVVMVIGIINVTSLILDQVNNLKIDNSTATNYLDEGLSWINQRLERFNIPVQITLEEVVSNLKSSITGLLNGVVSTASSISSFSIDVVINLVIFYGVTFMIIPKFDEIIGFIKKVIPFEEEITDLYIRRTLETAKSMVWGLFVIAIAQSAVTGLILYILGTPYVLVIMLITAIMSLFPIAGTGIVNFPIAIIYLLTGNIWKGLILIVLQVIVIGNIDVFLRAKLVPKDVRMSIFVSLIAIFGGLAIWGIWGLIYGPVIFMLLLTTIEVIKKYYIPSIRGN